MSLFSLSAAKPADVEVSNPPSDSISALAWSPNADLLAAASWSNEVRVFEVGPNGVNQGKAMYSHEGPALCAKWSKDGTKIVSGGADNAARMFDAGSGQSTQIGAHDAPIKCVDWIDVGGGLVVTGSWDKTLRYWDLRQQAPVVQVTLPERCYAMDCVYPLLVVGTAERHMQIFNLNNPGTAFKTITSPLRMQTRTLACLPDASGYVLASIEGRCAIQYVEDSKTSLNFSFKCHRKDMAKGSQTFGSQFKTGSQQVFAVNDLSFNSMGTFVTAGSDGTLNIWDHNSRTRLKTIVDVGGPVVAARFNHSSQYLAYAISYDWSQGYQGNTAAQKTKIMLHPCQEDEVKPKIKK
ncbi:RNA export factor gle2 [Rhodotorula toruloides]